MTVLDANMAEGIFVEPLMRKLGLGEGYRSQPLKIARYHDSFLSKHPDRCHIWKRHHAGFIDHDKVER